MDKIIEIRRMAKKHGWWLVDHQVNIKLLIFQRGTSKINIYYSKMTIATTVDHPRVGRQQLYRKNITEDELKKIFKEPRQHTGKGYWNRIKRFFRT